MLDQIVGSRGALALSKTTGQDFENGLTQLYCCYTTVVNLGLFYRENVTQ
jgi:hypothetical protein